MKKFLAFITLFFCSTVFPLNASASPWAEKQGYFAKTGGKALFGLKNSLMGWMAMFAESKEPGYATEWNGFCVGLAKAMIYTPSGLIQLATFPIPVDFPNIGRGIHLPDRPKPVKKAQGAVDGKKKKNEKSPPSKGAQPVEFSEDTESVSENR